MQKQSYRLFSSLETVDDNEPINILFESDAFAILEKPPSIPCHNSDYVGRRKPGSKAPLPLLQRGRAVLNERRINLVHRLDQGASG